MSQLLTDPVIVKNFSRDLKKQDVLIKAILNDPNLKSYCNSLTRAKYKFLFDDVFHDSIINFIRAVQKPGFEFTGNPKDYLKRVMKNSFLSILKRRKINVNNLDLEKIDVKYEEDYFINFDRKQILNDLLSKIGEDCKNVLTLWAMKFKMIEIANSLNYGTENYAKKKKHICLKKLIALVEANSKLKEQLKEYV